MNSNLSKQLLKYGLLGLFSNPGWCSTPNQLLMCSSFIRENGHHDTHQPSQFEFSIGLVFRFGIIGSKNYTPPLRTKMDTQNYALQEVILNLDMASFGMLNFYISIFPIRIHFQDPKSYPF